MSDLSDLRAGLQHLLAHLSPTSGYGRLYQGQEIEDVYLVASDLDSGGRAVCDLFPDATLAHHIGPQGITSAIHPFVRLLRDAILADDGIIGLGFLRSEPGAIWPYFRDKYNEVYFFTGCSWNSGEGGRGYQDMQAIFGLLASVYGLEVVTVPMTQAQEATIEELIRVCTREQSEE